MAVCRNIVRKTMGDNPYSRPRAAVEREGVELPATVIILELERKGVRTMARMMDLIPFDMALRPLRNLWRPYPYGVECENWVPATDIAETGNSYIVSMEIPGIDMKKLDISYRGGVLSVRGEKTKETMEGECCQCVERFSGSFDRSFPVSGAVDEDKIDATYRDGVLKIVIPKSEESVSKRIAVH
jgi:HSP20 family protein